MALQTAWHTHLSIDVDVEVFADVIEYGVTKIFSEVFCIDGKDEHILFANIV
jgi:hypothetical protein